MNIPPSAAPVRLGPESAQALADLEARCFPDSWDAAAFAAAFDRAPFAAYGVADGEGGLAAYATFHFLGDEFEVISIAVDPALRGRGLGGRLFGHVLQQVDKMGMTRGYLEVRAGNAPAKRLYLRHGFAAVGVRRRYYPDNGEDALVMVRESTGTGSP
ncbi:ribosomal protein S18-alanine N-acetyltransferase [Solidesulfovibrio sp.]|uniref:ribosomal protein S18-alanine N-acetyltransferase n=1 Tax=Solidesulfovibrio sp. TaxID=2910990 RepID=UPI00261EF766|nr:ribosomal protein S18-alanine N-acetyltransferase [Solidesulfovibrio sp.]